MIHLKLVIYVELTRFVGGIDDLVGSGFGGGLEEFANGFVFRVLVGADLDAELRISSYAGADGSFDLFEAANLVTDVEITLGIDGENAAVAGVFSNLTLSSDSGRSSSTTFWLLATEATVMKKTSRRKTMSIIGAIWKFSGS